MAAINISDITADNDRMVDQMDIDPDVREKVRKKLDEAMEMLSQEGVDPAQAIMNMIGINDDPMGEKEAEGREEMREEMREEHEEMNPRKKALIIAIIKKKKNGKN